MDLVAIDKGSCTLKTVIKETELNGFSITHGGVLFSLADSAVAFAANSYGYKAVTIENSISYLKPSFLSSVITATCSEIHKGKTLGRYVVELHSELESVKVAVVNATVHFSNELW
jgi:uncharacterized domain 1